MPLHSAVSSTLGKLEKSRTRKRIYHIARLEKTTELEKQPPLRDGFPTGPIVLPALLVSARFSSPAFSLSPPVSPFSKTSQSAPSSFPKKHYSM